jgi:hypothetical protein
MLVEPRKGNLAMPQPAFGIFEADDHDYELRDAFTRHLDPRFTRSGSASDAAIRAMVRDNGRAPLGLP